MRFRREKNKLFTKTVAVGLLVGLQFFVGSVSSFANDYVRPWKQKNRAIVIDAYEKNEIDWLTLAKNKRVRAFINKASDGLPSPWKCRKKGLEQVLCKKTFQNFFMKQQIYHTRKLLAKSLGMKWGAYHLGRPGNPIDQANNFIDFADPQEDELIALDIEDNDPDKWISFEDAEIFAKHIYHRLGRYPVLYTNHSTAKAIAQRRHEFPILSRMQLWYARFKDRIPGVFPMGNWDNYAMWQFSAGTNCNNKRCLMRIAGTPNNIDVNITTMNIEEFDAAWPFNGLLPSKDFMMVFNDLDYVEDPRMIYDGSRLVASLPTQGNRGLLEPKLDEPANQEMLMVEYHRPMDEVYAIDETVVASVAKAGNTHPLHQAYPVSKTVEVTEMMHPLHQAYPVPKTIEVTEMTHPLHQAYPVPNTVKVTEMTHPLHQAYPVSKTVKVTEMTHPLHQAYSVPKTVEVTEMTHPLHQAYPVPNTVEVTEMMHPLHQSIERIQVVKMDEVKHPLHQLSEVAEVIEVAEVSHPLHQICSVPQAIEVTSVTHPLHQDYPVLREIEKAEKPNTLHQQRQASLTVGVMKELHPLHQRPKAGHRVENVEDVLPHHQELDVTLGVDENFITASIEQPLRIHHPLYYR